MVWGVGNGNFKPYFILQMITVIKVVNKTSEIKYDILFFCLDNHVYHFDFSF